MLEICLAPVSIACHMTALPAPSGLTTSMYKFVVADANMFQVIVDLFMAGSETTTTTLRWTLLYMILNPEIQAKCRREMSQVTSNNNKTNKLFAGTCNLEAKRYAPVLVNTTICHSRTALEHYEREQHGCN